MMVRNFLRMSLIACMLLLAVVMALPSTAFAQGATPASRGTAAEIDKFMVGYTRDLTKHLGSGSRVEYSTSSIAANADTRSCAKPLSISARDQTQSLSRVTLLVVCGNEWSIYVPIDLNTFRPVAIANKPLAGGAVVQADDVELSAVDVSQVVGTYITTLDDVVGMGVKRPITQGRPILSQQLEQPILIRRGEAVVISAQSGELAVKMTGIALTDGRRGELIRIKNQTSSRVVDGRVVAPGQVLVPM